MFNEKANAAFINGSFTCATIRGMHETMIRLYEAARLMRDLETQTDVALAMEQSPQTLSNWERRGMSKGGMLIAEEKLGCSAQWIRTGIPPMEARGAKADVIARMDDDGEVEVMRIPYYLAKGSCGNGVIVFDEGPKGHLIKEETFFKRYGVAPDDVIAIYAQGNSNADFIVDGDIVLFNRRKTEPKSGEMFLIDHPDGLKIKRLRRLIDGSWALESRNPDKQTYPDEFVRPDHAEMLRVLGQFFYRQGG